MLALFLYHLSYVDKPNHKLPEDKHWNVHLLTVCDSYYNILGIMGSTLTLNKPTTK